MNIPASDHFTPVSLSAVFNAHRAGLPAALRAPDSGLFGFGPQALLGLPFELGQPESPNVILLDQAPVAVELNGLQATYLIFLHVVGDRPAGRLAETDASGRTGNELGQHVSDYVLEFSDDTSASTPILRRYAIQQGRIRWGASPFAAIPALKPQVILPLSAAQALGRVGAGAWGGGETRLVAGRDSADEHLWLYALPNPHPEKPLRRLVLIPRAEPSVIYAISSTLVETHPLQPGLRQKLRLRLDPQVSLNAIDELDDVDLDLGQVISARRALDYDHAQWLAPGYDVQPSPAPDQVLIEYAAHPQAKLYVPAGQAASPVYELSQPHAAIVPVPAAHRPVRLRIVERGSARPVPARLHLHGQAGEYLPPRGHHRQVNAHWFEDLYAEFINGRNQYSYVPGECVVDLPLGEVFAALSRGPEVAPLRTSVQITPATDEVTFELDRPLRWRDLGWVTADTHVHFLSPQTALLEGAAEGVNVVNLLASQWGEMFSNVGDFDGRTTFGARDFGGDGEFLVRVGTENRMQVLGHISLLGYDGPMIHPLCTGGPSESALGDPQAVAMAEWARQCIAQNGLVVMPHAPDPQCERAADIVLGLVHAIEMMTFNPFDWQIQPAGLADWYQYLNLGYQLPLVGGSDKMSAASLLGGVRAYAHLGDRPFTYADWKQAVRAGNTFVTVGPLVQIAVEGQPPGSRVTLPATGGTVSVTWSVESAGFPAETLEFVVGGLTAESLSLQAGPNGLLRASGSVELKISQSTWIAARVRGGYRGRPGDIAAHTSAVNILVGDRSLWSEPDANAVLAQINGALAYVDALALHPDPVRLQELRALLAAAHDLLHQRPHAHHAH
jgi:hypothetical protein